MGLFDVFDVLLASSATSSEGCDVGKICFGPDADEPL